MTTQHNIRVLQTLLELPYDDAVEYQSVPWNDTFIRDDTDKANFGIVQKAYDACMDTATITKLGATPLAKVITDLDAIWPVSLEDLNTTITTADYDGLSRMIYYLEEIGVKTYATMSGINDFWDPVGFIKAALKGVSYG